MKTKPGESGVLKDKWRKCYSERMLSIVEEALLVCEMKSDN